jgi:serine/threonine-protein kinase RsbW
MNGRETLSVPGTILGIQEAVDALEAWVGREGVPGADRRRLLTALDEVLSNVVRHGWQGQPGTIDVTFAREAGTVRVEVSDSGAPFNPLLSAAPDTSAPLEHRAVGGLGITLVRALAHELHYERRDERNCLTMTWRISG